MSVNNLAKLTSMNFLKLKETGGLDFHTVPVMLETINLAGNRNSKRKYYYGGQYGSSSYR